ncbi:hypothetical protein [Vogesella oryzae]|uniref:hypothetical protein n=1 Tax=Vogesella oryzae TaxID=1735285 RepID=UPI0015843B3D|nr:hypothetical protein [Vogesella oryzae]
MNTAFHHGHNVIPIRNRAVENASSGAAQQVGQRSSFVSYRQARESNAQYFCAKYFSMLYKACDCPKNHRNPKDCSQNLLESKLRPSHLMV